MTFYGTAFSVGSGRRFVQACRYLKGAVSIEFFRVRIENQVFNLTGLALNTIDYEQPKGDPGLFGPDAICWQVHRHFPAMICGGISALMLQMLHPAALAGVWDHSNFRQDMLGRLRRTSQFVAGTTFASRADALALIDRVNQIHEQVRGKTAAGKAYYARDPELLRWVHACEVYSFINGYQRYSNTPLSPDLIDQYLTETALIPTSLGADWVPTTWTALEQYLETMRSELIFDHRTQEVLAAVVDAPAPTPAGILPKRILTHSAANLLPDWAQAQIGHHPSAVHNWVNERLMRRLTAVLYWAVRNGASSRARRRFVD